MKRRILSIVGLLAALSLLSSCQREATTDALELTGKLFVFNYRLSYATYMITLAQKQALPEGSTVFATFDNPAKGAPLTLERRIFPKLDKVVLESPDVTCVKKDVPYKVGIEVRGPDGSVLQRLETTVISSLDQSILPPIPMIIGPAYEKNPAVFKNGSAIPDLSGGQACPA